LLITECLFFFGILMAPRADGLAPVCGALAALCTIIALGFAASPGSGAFVARHVTSRPTVSKALFYNAAPPAPQRLAAHPTSPAPLSRRSAPTSILESAAPLSLLGALVCSALLTFAGLRLTAGASPSVAIAASTAEVERPRGFRAKLSPYAGYLKAVTPATYLEVEALLKDGYTLVDVRPAFERVLIHPVGSQSIEFVVEHPAQGLDLLSLGRRMASSSYAGSFRDLVRNPAFFTDFAARFPKDAKVIVGCGDGLRSLIATKELQDKDGYTSLRWLQDGFQMLAGRPGFASTGTEVAVGYAEAGLDPGPRLGAAILRSIAGGGK